MPTPTDAPGLRRPPSQQAVRTYRRPAHWSARIMLALGGLAVCGLWWTDPASAAITSPGAALTAAGRVAGLVGA
ncbi:MAG TPA: hypothetical protein VG317_10915 [Pseudonocardiaceae bacterium]|nr:hypothetical protein [Pseudonocardiaceae bacterium]